MKAVVIECPFGILAVNKGSKLVEKRLFTKKPRIAAKAFMKIEAGKIVDEVLDLINVLQKSGYDSFVFEKANLAEEVQKKLGVKIEVSKTSKEGEKLRMGRLAVKTGFASDIEEFNRWMHDFAVEFTKLKVKQAGEKRDLIIVQAIQTLDDLDKNINLFMGRVREWYGIHFPELDRLLDKHETYAHLVFELGDKDKFTEETLDKEGIPESKVRRIVKAVETSMGADLTETDLTQIQALCKTILDLYQLRQRLDDYLDTIMEEVAPNIKAIVGALLGARLITLAGGLMNLAKMPSSTIQVLGAEKALFRSLKTGARPPKHGIIFQHVLLHEARKWQRGKIARAIAGKLAIAARTDAFGSRYIGEELKADLEMRAEEIYKKYDQPTLIPKREAKRKKRRRKKRASKG